MTSPCPHPVALHFEIFVDHPEVEAAVAPRPIDIGKYKAGLVRFLEAAQGLDVIIEHPRAELGCLDENWQLSDGAGGAPRAVAERLLRGVLSEINVRRKGLSLPGLDLVPAPRPECVFIKPVHEDNYRSHFTLAGRPFVVEAKLDASGGLATSVVDDPAATPPDGTLRLRVGLRMRFELPLYSLLDGGGASS